MYLVSLERRSDSWRPAARTFGVEAPPRVRENRVLARTDSLADLALAKVGTGSLAAYLTDFDPTTPWVKLKQPASDGRLEPLRARLGMIGLRPDGTPLAPEQALSVRAHSLGGIALAPGATGSDVLAAWTGMGRGQAAGLLDAGRGGRRTPLAAHADAQERRHERRGRHAGEQGLARRLGRRAGPTIRSSTSRASTRSSRASATSSA